MFSPLQPFVYLLAYLAVQYIRPQDYVPALMGTPLLQILLLPACAFWLARQPKNFEASQHRLLLVLFLLMALSVALTGWMGGVLQVFGDFGPTLLLFYLVATSVDSLARLRAIFWLLSAASCVMALHGISQIGNEQGIGWTGAKMTDGRITYLGFLNDPNDLAMSLLMTLPMCLHLAERSQSFLLRWAIRAAGLLIMYGVFLTNSRGAMLGLGAMLLVYGIGRYGLWRALIVVPLLAAPLLALAPSRIGEISADEDSAAGRVEAWYEGFQMLRSHPLFGVGKGLFTEHHNLTAHNSYMLAVAELGLVGYFVWLSIIALTVIMLLGIVRLGRNERTEAVAAPAVPLLPSRLPYGTPVVRHGAANNVSETPLVASASAGFTDADTGLAGVDTWAECQHATRTLLYGMVAALVCAFFLSRSYAVNLYLQMALVVAVYQLVRAKWPAALQVSFGPIWRKLLAGSMGSVLVLWVVTRVLL